MRKTTKNLRITEVPEHVSITSIERYLQTSAFQGFEVEDLSNNDQFLNNWNVLMRIVSVLMKWIICQNQNYFTTGGLPPISSFWRKAPCDSRHSNFIFQLNTCGYSHYVTSSLTRGWICSLQLLLVLASAVIFRSDSNGTRDHILLSQIRDSPNVESQVP
jgi:hypothetical protein